MGTSNKQVTQSIKKQPDLPESHINFYNSLTRIINFIYNQFDIQPVTYESIKERR